MSYIITLPRHGRRRPPPVSAAHGGPARQAFFCHWRQRHPGEHSDHRSSDGSRHDNRPATLRPGTATACRAVGYARWSPVAPAGQAACAGREASQGLPMARKEVVGVPASGRPATVAAGGAWVPARAATAELAPRAQVRAAEPARPPLGHDQPGKAGPYPLVGVIVGEVESVPVRGAGGAVTPPHRDYRRKVPWQLLQAPYMARTSIAEVLSAVAAARAAACSAITPATNCSKSPPANRYFDPATG